MRSRVMPGSLVTIERRVPVRRLKSEDLPTLGRPTITKDGVGAVIFKCDRPDEPGVNSTSGQCALGRWRGDCNEARQRSKEVRSERTARQVFHIRAYPPPPCFS